MENDFSGPDYGNANLDEYDFDYQDFYLPMDSSMNMDPDYALSNGGSQGIDNHTGQIESRPETPDRAPLHKEYLRGPQSQSPGSSPPSSPSLNGSSDSATDEAEELELVTAFRENPTI